MKVITNLLFSIFLTLFAGCGAILEDTSNRISLFNGKNLDGWVIENNGQFFVEGDVLRVNKGTGWLRSAQPFEDFKMTMEFRFLEERANSGIFVRTAPTSNNDENGWPNNGYQIQCADGLDRNFPLAHLIQYGAPEFQSETDLEALKSVYRPAGEWQTCEITCQGESLEIVLNGKKITTATSIKNRTGHVGIQGEHGLLEFRKINLSMLN